MGFPSIKSSYAYIWWLVFFFLYFNNDKKVQQRQHRSQRTTKFRNDCKSSRNVKSRKYILMWIQMVKCRGGGI